MRRGCPLTAAEEAEPLVSLRLDVDLRGFDLPAHAAMLTAINWNMRRHNAEPGQ